MFVLTDPPQNQNMLLRSYVKTSRDFFFFLPLVFFYVLWVGFSFPVLGFSSEARYKKSVRCVFTWDATHDRCCITPFHLFCITSPMPSWKNGFSGCQGEVHGLARIRSKGGGNNMFILDGMYTAR